MSFTYNVQQKEPVAVIALYGELVDRSLAQELLHNIESISGEGQNHFVLDLSELKYMNSTGLNVLINALTLARKAGGDVVISGVSHKVQELLLVTKLNSVFTVTPTAEEGIAHFNN